MKILAFDSSNQTLTVAVVAEETLLAEQIINVKRNHSIQLMPAIDEALKQSELTLEDIDRLAVASGPGSYTGLRIAVTIAKSLAWSKNIDLVGVSSLKVIAANSLAENNQLIVPLFDARRENIYTAVYHRNDRGELIQLEEDTHVSAKEWAAFLGEKYPEHRIQLIGMDAEKFSTIFSEKLADQVSLSAASQKLPRGSVLARLGRLEDVVDSDHFIPTYLKLAEAEENWLKEHPDFKGGAFVEKI